MNTKRQRIVKLIVLCLLVSCLAFSFLFLMKEAGHRCEREDCTVCTVLHQMRQMGKRLLGGGMQAALLGALWMFAELLPEYILECRIPETLVSRKVRMDD